MGIKIKNLQTGEFEKFNIPALKGEKGEPGEIEPSEKVDYIGKQHSKLRDTMNANVDYIIKTAIGEFNYLDYEGQHITATNSIEGHSKSAILKGQTLVNLINVKNATGGIVYTTKDLNLAYELPVGKYILFYDIIKANTSSGLGKPDRHTPIVTFNDGSKIYQGFEGFNTSNGKKYWIINATTPIVKVEYWLANLVEDGEVDNLRLFAYQDGMENWDIPYFTGMQSVKMPVLTTMGKNTWNTNEMNVKFDSGLKDIQYFNNSIRMTNDYQGWRGFSFKNKQSLTYLSFDVSVSKVNDTTKYIRVVSDGVQLGRYDLTNGRIKVRLPQNSEEIKIQVLSENGVDVDFEFTNIQLEKDSFTSYEPFKSNILSCNEDVTLRGINNKKDTLDYNSGIKTGMIGEMVLKGTEDYKQWMVGNQTAEGMIGIYTRKDTIDTTENGGAYILCDKLPIAYRANLQNTTENSVIKGSGYIGIVMKANSVDEVKAWLRENPVTVQYGLATSVIKTVDLSDNHIYSYKGTTHYSCSSEEGSLVPTLSVKVPTDTQLTIQEQKATTQTLLIKNMDLQQSIKEVQAMNLAFNTALYNSFNSIREEVEDIKKHVSTNENLEGSF